MFHAILIFIDILFTTFLIDSNIFHNLFESVFEIQCYESNKVDGHQSDWSHDIDAQTEQYIDAIYNDKVVVHFLIQISDSDGNESNSNRDYCE